MQAKIDIVPFLEYNNNNKQYIFLTVNLKQDNRSFDEVKAKAPL